MLVATTRVSGARASASVAAGVAAVTVAARWHPLIAALAACADGSAQFVLGRFAGGTAAGSDAAVGLLVTSAPASGAGALAFHNSLAAVSVDTLLAEAPVGSIVTGSAAHVKASVGPVD